jgi:hypothetical protein
LLDQLAAEYGFTVYQLDASSPAGRRLAQVTGLRRLPGIYIDLQLVAYGRPRPQALRQTIARYFAC